MLNFSSLQRVTTTINTTKKKRLPNLEAGHLASKSSIQKAKKSKEEF